MASIGLLHCTITTRSYVCTYDVMDRVPKTPFSMFNMLCHPGGSTYLLYAVGTYDYCTTVLESTES